MVHIKKKKTKKQKLNTFTYKTRGMYICAGTYMCVSIHVHIYTHTHIFMHSHLFVYIKYTLNYIYKSKII